MKLRIGIYSKTLIFFVIFAVIAAGVYYWVLNNLISASISDVIDLDVSRGVYELPITILPDSQVKVADTIEKNLITPEDDYDLFKYVVFSREGIYVDELNVLVHLPRPISSLQELKARDYAVHGVSNTRKYLLNSQTIVFKAYDLSPGSTFTIELSLPKNFVQLSWSKQLWLKLTKISWYFWILIGNIPLFITLVILFYLYNKTSSDWRKIQTKKILEKPPSDLSPAAVSALVTGNISSRAMAATFIDLARRGKIQIIDKGEYFTFLKTNLNALELRNFEKILFDKIFLKKKITSSVEDVELRISKHVFSRKIAKVYLQIYNELYEKGYFNKDPNKYQAGYKRIGYIMFLIGVIGFIANIIFGLSSIYFLLVWFSIVIGAIFIVKISPRLPIKNHKGLSETREWFAFKNFLSMDKPYTYSYEAQRIYEQYLPYAIALNCEQEWTKRFIKHPFSVPKWLITGETTVLLEDVLNKIIPFVDFISYKLTQIKEPIM